MLTDNEIERILTDSGALLTGHFLLTSGKHSDKYMQCAKILQYPDYSEALARHLAEQLTDLNADVVAGPAMGGIIIAYELARHLKCVNIFAERESGKMVLRRGFDELVKGKRVIVAEDVITTGGSVAEVIEAVRENGGFVVGAAVLVDRSGGKADFGVPLAAAYNARFDVFEPENCPLCAEGKIQPIKPGSRKS